MPPIDSELVLEDLRRFLRQCEADGLLVSRSQLDSYFAHFREEFGPFCLLRNEGSARGSAARGCAVVLPSLQQPRKRVCGHVASRRS